MRIEAEVESGVTEFSAAAGPYKQTPMYSSVCAHKNIAIVLYMYVGLTMGNGRLIRKKVEVSLRLFDIFERNRVFTFLCGS